MPEFNNEAGWIVMRENGANSSQLQLFLGPGKDEDDGIHITLDNLQLARVTREEPFPGLPRFTLGTFHYRFGPGPERSYMLDIYLRMNPQFAEGGFELTMGGIRINRISQDIYERPRPAEDRPPERNAGFLLYDRLNGWLQDEVYRQELTRAPARQKGRNVTAFQQTVAKSGVMPDIAESTVRSFLSGQPTTNRVENQVRTLKGQAGVARRRRGRKTRRK